MDGDRICAPLRRYSEAYNTMAISKELPREAQQVPARPAMLPIILLIALTGLAALLYTRAISWWYMEWTADGSYYAHGVFIPFFVAAMIWRDREKLRRLPITHSWWGLSLIALAMAAVLYAYRADVTVTLSISFILFLIGAVLTIAGRQMTRALLFPILFLLTMIPIIPNQVINVAGFPIQMASAKFASAALNLIGFHNTRIGTQIQMDTYLMNVEVPCSGFKTLIGLMAFSGAFAYLVEAAKWKRWVLFLISIPLAILVNGVRITLIGIVGEIFSTQAASTFHDYSGFIVLILGFMFLFSFARVLRCEKFFGIPLLDPPNDPNRPKLTDAEWKAQEAKEKAEQIEKLNVQYGAPRPQTLPLLSLGVFPVIAIVGLTAAVVHGGLVNPPKASTPIMRTEEVPTTVGGGEWSRWDKDRPISKIVQETLQPEIFLDRDYMAKSPKTGFINLLITGGSSRRTFHDPAECFTGSGFLIEAGGKETIQTEVGPVMVQEFTAIDPRKNTKRLLMFAFVVDGRLVHSMARVHAEIVRQTLLGGGTRPFYFLRFMQNAEGADEVRREELRSFIRAFWPTVAGRVLAEPPASARTTAAR